MQCFSLAFWADLQVVPVLRLGHSFDRETAVGAISLCSQETVRFRQMKVALKADHSQQIMADVKCIASCQPPYEGNLLLWTCD